LLGREWLNHLFPRWRDNFEPTPTPLKTSDDCVIKTMEEFDCKQFVENLEKQFPSVFSSDDNQTIKGFVAKIILKENVTPIFFIKHTQLLLL